LKSKAELFKPVEQINEVDEESCASESSVGVEIATNTKFQVQNSSSEEFLDMEDVKQHMKKKPGMKSSFTSEQSSPDIATSKGKTSFKQGLTAKVLGMEEQDKVA